MYNNIYLYYNFHYIKHLLYNTIFKNIIMFIAAVTQIVFNHYFSLSILVIFLVQSISFRQLFESLLCSSFSLYH